MVIKNHTFELADGDISGIQFQVLVPYKSDVLFVDQNDDLIQLAAEKKAIEGIRATFGPMFSEICGPLTVLPNSTVHTDEVEVFVETFVIKPKEEELPIIPYSGA